MNWKCTNCGNKVSSAQAPRVCDISCCGQEGSFVLDSDQTAPKKLGWKCTNCGNKVAGAIAPSICPITCCNESNSYVAID
jgi:DNA-directed RNA polymerase subunit RPC12/RpoP